VIAGVGDGVAAGVGDGDGDGDGVEVGTAPGVHFFVGARA